MAAIQVFGTAKCRDTQKAVRFFKERRVAIQLIDLAEKAPSRGELDSIRRCVPLEELIDRESREYERLHLAYVEHDPVETLLEHPLVMKTPVVRRANRAVAGYRPDEWEKLLGD